METTESRKNEERKVTETEEKRGKAEKEEGAIALQRTVKAAKEIRETAPVLVKVAAVRLWQTGKKTAEKIGESIRLYRENTQKKKDEDKTVKQLVKILPFLPEEERHSAFLRLSESGIDSRDAVAVLPYLSDADCDALFCRYLEENGSHGDPAAMAAYVSAGCLSRIVDGYLAGKYPDLAVEALYPFLAEEDIRRLTVAILENGRV